MLCWFTMHPRTYFALGVEYYDTDRPRPVWTAHSFDSHNITLMSTEKQGCRGYGYPWIHVYPCVDMRLRPGCGYPWILRWHNTIAWNLCKIPASYKLLTNCAFLMIICFNYSLLCIFITTSDRNACVMVVLIWRPTPCCALWNRSGSGV